MLPSSSLLPLFWSMSGYGLHGVSPISRRPPSEANPPTSDWIVWRVIEPDSSLLHKGKDKLPISTRAGGIPDRVHLSELLKMYQSLPQFSMREWGQRERKRELRSVSSAEPYYRAQAWLQSRVCSALHAERTEPHAQRNDRDKCPLAPRRGKLFPWLLLMGFYPWSNYSSPQSSPILQRGDVLVLHFLCVWS